MPYQTLNPATEKFIAQFDYFELPLIESKLSMAYGTFLRWKTWSIKERAQCFLRMADILDNNAAHYAQIIQLEMGKPVAEGEAEVKKCAQACRYFSEHASTFLTPLEHKTNNSRSVVRYDPLGIILAVMPWNFPFWQVIRVAIPTLMAGNVVVLKHAANTPQCALAIEKIFHDAGFPDGAFLSLFVSHDDVENIIADKRIQGVSLTGSSEAGSKVASVAGKHLKPCVLELGGSDPFIVFDDADINRATLIGAASRCLNSGQSCINAKRFIVHKQITHLFCDKLSLAMQAYAMGPLATRHQQKTVHEQVEDALLKGAQALCGATLPKDLGFFYPATVLTNLNPTMRLWHEEVFGPVASIFEFETDEHALHIANGTRFGLGSSVWTKDEKRIKRFVANLECGIVFVNDMVRSEPSLPFGGIKQSGFGRELAQEGIRSFVNIKTVFFG